MAKDKQPFERIIYGVQLTRRDISKRLTYGCDENEKYHNDVTCHFTQSSRLLPNFHQYQSLTFFVGLVNLLCLLTPLDDFIIY